MNADDEVDGMVFTLSGILNKYGRKIDRLFHRSRWYVAVGVPLLLLAIVVFHVWSGNVGAAP